MKRVMYAMCLLVCCATGCADAFDEVMGAYKGTSTLYNATNFGMTNQTVEDVITVTSPDKEKVFIGLDPTCVLMASVEDETLTIAKQSCMFSGQNSTDTWFYEGTGMASGGALTLNLSGTFTRVYMAGGIMTPPLNGNHKLDFTGTRQ